MIIQPNNKYKIEREREYDFEREREYDWRESERGRMSERTNERTNERTDTEKQKKRYSVVVQPDVELTLCGFKSRNII
jgi:hypothetical protein